MTAPAGLRGCCETSTESASTTGPRPGAWQLTLTVAGTVAVVNGVVIGACVGRALTMRRIGSLVIALTAGAAAILA
jgi:hypothetical protein